MDTIRVLPRSCIIDYERFTISPAMSGVSPVGSFAIRTVRGFYLTAAAGGGQTDAPVLYTNGTIATAHQFGLLKSGDALARDIYFASLWLADHRLFRLRKIFSRLVHGFWY